MSSSDEQFDLVVVGSGPGGYTAAVRAAKGGLKTGLVESRDLGGVCLNWGCIPTKALLHSAGLWRDLKGLRRHGLHVEGARFDYPAVVRRSRQVVSRLVKGLELLMKETGVEVLQGRGRLTGEAADGAGGYDIEVSGDSAAQRYRASSVILATGGVTRALPGLPFDGRRVLSSRDAVTLTELPTSLLIVGAGAIGLEFADLFSTFGVKVTVVELLPRILSTEDEDVAQVLRDALSKRGVRVYTGVRLVESAVTDEGVTGRIVPAATSAGEDATRGEEISAECVLVAVGVDGAVDGLGLETLGLQPERGFLPVNDVQRTVKEGIYAIGDLTGPPLLAHKASAEGVCVAEHLLGLNPTPISRAWIPGAVFTHPQVASVGARERDLISAGTDYRVGRFPFSALGKAVAEGEVTGFVKVLVASQDGALLGAHAIGAMASELIAELTLAGTHGVDAKTILHTIHTHPTLSEAVPEACGTALGTGIHG